ncbi:MAG: NAD-dependent epimerase/dehydratase family protein [Thermoleophilaceae bacterium]
MPTRRVLITGLSTYWGGRLAQALEEDDNIEAIIGVDNRDPTRELDRTEFVRVGTQHALLRRLVEAAEIDTVVDSRLVVDSVTTSPRKAHENNVIGTMNILAACTSTSVRRFVFKSSAHYYGTAQDDPAFFTESMGRPHPPRTRIERDIVEAEASVRDFAEKNPHVATTIMRFANVLGPDVRTSHTALFSLPVVPMILGFDPRYQFVHEDDVVVALGHAVRAELPGIYNVAADGVLALTEVIDLLGKRWAPMLPPWGTGLAAAGMRRLGLRIPPEMLGQLRFGRGLDNRKLKASGFAYRYTSRETVIALAEYLRLHPVMRGAQEPYRYEREVEDFLRWSPHVKSSAYRPQPELSPSEADELARLYSAHAERTGTTGGDSPVTQAEALVRAAKRDEEGRDAASSLGDPAGAEPGREPAGAEPGREPAASGAPIERYDDLEPEEVVSLLGSMDTDGLLALRDHERSAGARPRILAAIDGVLARREAAQRG